MSDFILNATGSYWRVLSSEMIWSHSRAERSLWLQCREGTGREAKVKVEDKLKGGCDISGARWWLLGIGDSSRKGQKYRTQRYLGIKCGERGKMNHSQPQQPEGEGRQRGGCGRQEVLPGRGPALWGQTARGPRPARRLSPPLPRTVHCCSRAYLVAHLRVFLLPWWVCGGVRTHWCLFPSAPHDPYQPAHLA